MERIEEVDYDNIKTITGIHFNVFDPKVENINAMDMAHALAHQCRWAGHVKKFYSVAEHSLVCSRHPFIANDLELRYQALLHDSSEAYLMDIPSPIKPRLENYKSIEKNLMNKIADALAFDYPLDDKVKHVDHLVLLIEWDQLMTQNKPLSLDCFTPEVARVAFIEEFQYLQKELGL